MTAQFPLPRQTRESDVIVAEEGQQEFGPFDFVLYDTDDNIVLARAPAGASFEDVTADTNNVPVSGSFPSHFLTVFNEGLPAGTEVQVVGRRIHERSTNVTQGGAIRSTPLEGELTRQGAVLQELRRDVDRADPAPAIAAAAEAEQHMEAAEAAADTATGAIATINAIIAASAANLLIIQESAPSDAEDGVNGNLYIDTSHARLAVYGPKAAGAWGAPIGFVIGLDGEGTGDVTGPAGATDEHIAVFDGVTGKLLKDGGSTIAGVIDAALSAVRDGVSAAFDTLAEIATELANKLTATFASDANVSAAAAGNLALRAAHIETASAYVALTDAATVAVDWDTGINFSLTVTANRAIGNPTNGQPGTYRTILVQGNDATDRTITFGNQFLGDVPVIADCDSTKWYDLTIKCITATHFTVVALVAKKP